VGGCAGVWAMLTGPHGRPCGRVGGSNADGLIIFWRVGERMGGLAGEAGVSAGTADLVATLAGGRAGGKAGPVHCNG
jgi:hypothetical protein